MIESAVFVAAFCWFFLLSPSEGGSIQPRQPNQLNQYKVSNRTVQRHIDSPRTKQKIVRYIKKSNPSIDKDEAEEIAHWIDVYSKKESVDPYLVAALIERESSFKKRAVSKTGAKGLGQIKDFNHKSLKISDPFNVKENIRGTVSYLKRMQNIWAGSKKKTELSLASYYQGPNATKKKKKNLSQNVKGYVNDIMERYRRLSSN